MALTPPANGSRLSRRAWASRAMYDMVPARPSSIHRSKCSAVSAGPVRVMPTRSKPRPSACALIAALSITNSPACITHDVRCRWNRVRVSVGGEHPPLYVLAIGKGQKREAPEPSASPKPPGDADERRGRPRIEHPGDRQLKRESHP